MNDKDTADRVDRFLKGLIALRESTGCSLTVSQGHVDLTVFDDDNKSQAVSVDWMTTSTNTDPDTGEVNERGISIRLGATHDVFQKYGPDAVETKK